MENGNACIDLGGLGKDKEKFGGSVDGLQSFSVLMDLAMESGKYFFPRRRFESRNLEVALMSVPDLETPEFRVIFRRDQYEIREVEL
ncbi:hypothetical protein Sjap_004751 [Stephania japonica]|uniref:Uncharacterized protein n=1 Tax=Stephania japonica TaxID=461633 RepID=A0AAP0PH99_9MAGN